LAQGSEESLTLNPGEEVIYNKTQGTLQKASATGQQFDYRNNILYFKNAGVAEVVQKLGSYYHKKVIVKGLADAKWSLSGEFDYRPLETVMQAIAYSCNIQYQLTDSLIVLAPNDPLPNSINAP
jgi:ferric-dicitrate binding protein FerR (iron transport regulator)